MISVKVEHLCGVPLRYAVVKSLNLVVQVSPIAYYPWFIVETFDGQVTDANFFHHLDVLQIIKDNLFGVTPKLDGKNTIWVCTSPRKFSHYWTKTEAFDLETAVFRCLVATKLGGTVDVPEQLML